MRSMIVVAAAAAALVSGTAGADDRTGYKAIAAGDFAAAEDRITDELRTYPRQPELMINLASVYAKTGRNEQARELYRAVLSRPDMMMDMPSGTVRSSHALARAGLVLSAPVIASR